MMPIVYFHMFNFLHNPVYLEKKNCINEIFTIYDISLEMGWLGIVIMLLLDGKCRIKADSQSDARHCVTLICKMHKFFTKKRRGGGFLDDQMQECNAEERMDRI